MDLCRRLEILFSDKGKMGVDMDALMDDFDVIRPYLRGVPLAMTDPLVVSINEPPRKKDLVAVLRRLREDIELLQQEKPAVEALHAVSKYIDASISHIVDLRARLETLRISLERTEQWIEKGYNPKGGAAPKHYPDMPYLIALFKEHVDPNPTSTPAGLFSEFVNEIVMEIQPNADVGSLRGRIEDALAETANQVDLQKFRDIDPTIMRQISKVPATRRPLIQIDHPNMDVWKNFLATADDSFGESLE